MTTIAGVAYRGRVWLGGDSAGTTDAGSSYLLGSPKVWRIGPLVLGITGFAKWEIGLAKFRPSATDVLAELERHVVGLGGEEDNEALVGYNGKLWIVEPTGAIYPLAGPTTAIGSGADAARGYLFERRGPPEKLVRGALRAATALTDGTRPPFHVVRT